MISEATVQSSQALHFFKHCALIPTNSFHSLHPLFDGWLREERPFLEFLQYPGPLILLLESPNCLIDRFVITDDNADQKIHLLTVRTLCYFVLESVRTEILDEFPLAQFFKRNCNGLNTT